MLKMKEMVVSQETAWQEAEVCSCDNRFLDCFLKTNLIPNLFGVPPISLPENSLTDLSPVMSPPILRDTFAL